MHSRLDPPPLLALWSADDNIMFSSRARMVSDRRRGGESSAMRAALIEAAEQLIQEEGYPAVTARNLAEKVDLKRQIVHYYFHTMDDVFIAVIRRNAERLRARLEAIMDSAEPLRELQVLNRDPAQAILAIELYALASRRPAVRAEVARAAAEARELQTRIVSHHLEQRGITPGMSPMVSTLLLTSLAQVLALEASIDFRIGHAETLEFVDACLRAFAEGSDVPFPTASDFTRGSTTDRTSAQKRKRTAAKTASDAGVRPKKRRA
jgi:AcrR family transcriptional regulator